MPRRVTEGALVVVIRGKASARRASKEVKYLKEWLPAKCRVVTCRSGPQASTKLVAELATMGEKNAVLHVVGQPKAKSVMGSMLALLCCLGGARTARADCKTTVSVIEGKTGRPVNEFVQETIDRAGIMGDVVMLAVRDNASLMVVDRLPSNTGTFRAKEFYEGDYEDSSHGRTVGKQESSEKQLAMQRAIPTLDPGEQLRAGLIPGLGETKINRLRAEGVNTAGDLKDLNLGTPGNRYSVDQAVIDLCIRVTRRDERTRPDKALRTVRRWQDSFVLTGQDILQPDLAWFDELNSDDEELLIKQVLDLQ